MDLSQYYDSSDAIIACSTGELENTAISVVRISGSIGPESVQTVLSKSGSIEPKVAYVVEIIKENEVLDEAVLTYFKAPNSYTGENVYEFAVHGNQINVKRLISHLSDALNLRKSAPGEFTYRALRNKKISLSQVEGLDQLLNAKSVFALDSGMGLLKGELQKEFLKLKNLFTDLKSAVELNTDFSEDVGEEAGKKIFNDKFNEFLSHITLLNRRGSIEPEMLLKPSIGLFGRPNAGKSTLFNKLLTRERSIVSEQAGTTRDYISETLMINNNQFELIDTAGLRSSNDSIEMEGVKRAEEIRKNCFYKILLINSEEDEKVDGEYDLVIYTHTDKNNRVPEGDGSIGANLLVDNISEQIMGRVSKKFDELTKNKPFTVPRHREAIKNIYEMSCNFEDLCSQTSDIAVISSELGSIEVYVNELLGQVSTDDVLKNIFNNFCIGK